MSLKKIVLWAVMLMFLASGLAFSQADREVIIMVKPGTIMLPEGKISAPIDSVTINSDTLQSVLISFNPELIVEAFPDFNLADTIAVSPFGDTFKRLNLSLVYEILLPQGIDNELVANTIDTLPGVVFAQPNGTRETDSPREPNDGFFSNQWGLKNTAQSGAGSVPGADIKATEAWEITTGNPNIKIGIIDKGVNRDNPDLSGKVSGDVSYFEGHGTHVAGIASAKTDNDTGIAGVDWNARIIAKKCTDSQGNLDYQKIHDGIVSAVNEGAAVLNGSFSGSEYNLLERSAFAYAYRMNVVSVVSMGNEYFQGNPIRYPAAYGQGIIAVGATTDGDVRSSYSNTGNHIDVVAPGGTHAFTNYDQHDIESTWHVWPWYVYLGGTSMAAPHVTGLASLLKGYRGDLQNDDIEQIIRISADTLEPMNHQEWTPEYGDGRINMHKALELLLHPNTLIRSTASGSYNAGNTNGYWMAFFATPNLADGMYYVKRYEARKNVTLPREFWGTPHVWGRTVGSSGYSGESPNLAIGYSSVVPGSTTSISATLYSFVYDVWDWELNHIGWVPCAPEGVSFGYSVLGEPKLLISTLSGLRTVLPPYIRLAWTDLNVNEQGYKIERKDATYNQWSEKASLDSNSTAWGDVDLVGSETYTYRVKAYNVHQNSSYSNEKVIKARPSAPANFSASLECVGYSPKIVPVSNALPISPPTLYDEVPSPCLEYSNRVFLSWSPPVNQKLPISYYKVVIHELNGPTTYDGPIYGLVDTLCLEKNTSYDLYVFAIDSEGDTGHYSIVQAFTTGDRNSLNCGEFQPKTITILPEDFYLGQNYPNPFNLQTRMEYGLPEDAHVKLLIYNILGEKVRVLVDEFQSAGERNVSWDGKNDHGEIVGSGIYFYRIQAGAFTKTAKMSLLK